MTHRLRPVKITNRHSLNRIIQDAIDFISRKLKLIIEVDGYSHQFKRAKDKLRNDKLNSLGYCVLRIDEYDIKKDFDNVIRHIESVVLEQEEKIQSP